MFHEALSRAELEARRLAAASDLPYLTTYQISKKYSVSHNTALRWRRKLESGGKSALKATKATGRPCRLTEAQLKTICQLQREEPRTTKDLAAFIEQKFGVHYDPDHVGRIMQKFGIPLRSQKRHHVQNAEPPAARQAATP